MCSSLMLAMFICMSFTFFLFTFVSVSDQICVNVPSADSKVMFSSLCTKVQRSPMSPDCLLAFKMLIKISYFGTFAACNI